MFVNASSSITETDLSARDVQGGWRISSTNSTYISTSFFETVVVCYYISSGAELSSHFSSTIIYCFWRVSVSVYKSFISSYDLGLIKLYYSLIEIEEISSTWIWACISSLTFDKVITAGFIA